MNSLFSFLFGGVGVVVLSVALSFLLEWRAKVRRRNELLESLLVEVRINIRDAAYDALIYKHAEKTVFWTPFYDLAARLVLSNPSLFKAAKYLGVWQQSHQYMMRVGDVNAKFTEANIVRHQIREDYSNYNEKGAEFVRMHLLPVLAQLEAELERVLEVPHKTIQETAPY